MSFILDALKKLEQKKHHGSVPDLMTVHAPEPEKAKKRPLWPYLVLAVLVLNAGILAAFFNPWESEEQTVVAQSISEEQKQPLPVSQEQDIPVIHQPAAPSPADREKDSTMSEAADKNPPVKEDNTATQAKTVIAAAESPDTPLEPIADNELESGEDNETPVEPESAQDTVKSFDPNLSVQELAALRDKIEEEQSFSSDNTASDSASIEDNGSEQEKPFLEFSQLPQEIKTELPDISISGHIYSNNPGSRMANINGHITREGENISRGLQVDEITMSGIIFNFQGVRFRMRAF